MNAERNTSITLRISVYVGIAAVLIGLIIYMLDMGDLYDTTWPGHLTSPVDKEVLRRILALAEDAAAGRAETKAFENNFFKGYVGTYRDEIGIVYKEPKE